MPESPPTQATANGMEGPTGEQQTATSSGSAGFGSLAKRITSRTTDLIAIAIVLMVGLSVGGSLVDWWRANPEDTVPDLQQSIGAMQWGAKGSPVALRFGGEGSALSRQTVAGDRRAVDEALRALCRQIVGERSAPTGPTDERERRFLNFLRTQSPIETRPGRWRLYRINAPVLMLVGVGGEPDSARTARQSDRTGLNRRDGAGPGDRSPTHRERVICWGLAFPTMAASWTVYTFRPSGDDSPRLSAVGEIPLPLGSRRILSARDRSAGEFCLFAGQGPPDVWMRFFDGWFKEHGGRDLPRWRTAGQRWWTRVVVSENQERSPNGTVDINIQRNSAGQWTGVVSLLPAKRK